jgi:hypothetical protein
MAGWTGRWDEMILGDMDEDGNGMALREAGINILDTFAGIFYFIFFFFFFFFLLTQDKFSSVPWIVFIIFSSK